MTFRPAIVRGLIVHLPVKSTTGEVYWAGPLPGWPTKPVAGELQQPKLWRPWKWRQFRLVEIKQPKL